MKLHPHLLSTLLLSASLASVTGLYAHGEFDPYNLDRPETENFDRSESEIRENEKAVVKNADRSRQLIGTGREFGPTAGSADDEPTGSLSGRIIYLMGGHGWEYSSGAYRTQRGVTNGMVEDFGNLDQITIMAEYLLNAGATVVPMRPFGNQEIEIIVDNDDPTVDYLGSWFNSSSTVFYGDTGDVPYRWANSVIGSTTASARYNATIAKEDFYPVYVFARTGSDRINQQYLVGHSGGVTSRRINHRRVGSGWIYLGTYHFEAGGTAYVEITNNAETGETGSTVIADAVRFGNGMGDVILDGAPTVSGKPREEEHGQYWAIESTGSEGSTFTGLSSVSSPRELAQYMNRETDGTELDRLYLSFHSNAGGGRGADGLYNSDSGSTVPNANNWNNGDPNTGDDLAQILGDAVNTHMTTLTSSSNPLDNTWGNSGGGNETYPSGSNSFAAFGEINYSLNPEMPQTIIEVAFHDSAEDATIMLDPKGRDALARATLQGVLEFFNTFDSGSSIELPSPPLDPYISQDAGVVTLNWTAPVAGGVYGVGGDAPTDHKVYISENGYGFALAQTVAGGTSDSLDVTSLCPAGETRYFRVSAVNAGGESFPTGTVAVRRSVSTSKVLIVNGFDRFSRTQGYVQTEPIPGIFTRVLPRYSNTFDYTVPYAKALSAADVQGIDSCQNDQVISGDVVLSDYETVYWISGEESTTEESFNVTEQGLLESYVASGGNLFASGSEIGWDIGWLGGTADKNFLNNTLRVATPLNSGVDDDADTYTAVGVPSASGLFDGESFTFSDGSDKRHYNVDYPDVFRPINGSETVIEYSGGAGDGQSAAIAHIGTGGRGNVIAIGFPFEAVLDPIERQEIIDGSTGFLGVSTGFTEWFLID